ncbi:MAG: hypothetical protein ABEH65_08700 [Halobacteriales archaeon]
MGTIAVTLVVISVLAGIGLVTVPLLVGQWLVRRLDGTPSEDALRQTVTAWPIAMGLGFVVFIVPGGSMQGDLLDLDGPRFCLLGFCGISVISWERPCLKRSSP